MPCGLHCGAYYSNCAVIGHFTCQTAYVTGLGGMSYCNQTLLLREGEVLARDYSILRVDDKNVELSYGFYMHYLGSIMYCVGFSFSQNPLILPSLDVEGSGSVTMELLQGFGEILAEDANNDVIVQVITC